MPSRKTPSTRTAGAISAAVLALVGAGLVTAGSPPARAASTSQLQQRIGAGQGRVSALAGAVGSANRQVDRLGGSISALEGQISRLQSDLDAKRAELLRLRDELTAARRRLAQLEASEARAERVLSQQMVGSYEADRPDLVSVVLESTGFNNLLERLAFAERIGNHDARIVGQVRAARRAVAAQATRLGALSQRQQRLTTDVLYERNRVDRARLSLVSQQIAATRVRDARAGQLSAAQGQVSSLRQQLAKLQAAQSAAQQSASSSSGPSAGSPSAPVHGSSSGGFTFPMPKGDVSPPATWSLDDGVDISAPGGTPELAVCSGTVVLHGIGGFGPSAPVIHCDSPLSGYDYVYYGHAGPGNWVAVGTHVGQGQVISQVGYGIVGISSGPHLEIGFADSSGSPIGPSSAPQMMTLLRAAYGA
ncbi:MAG: murein hydrolase activator EnvC family protein [Solirubrobacteraceae bacterium]